MDDDLGSCPCGSHWFQVGPPPDAELKDLTSDVSGVCISADGSVSGYAGVLYCLECGQVWATPDPRPQPVLRVINGGQGTDVAEDESDDDEEFWKLEPQLRIPKVIAFTQDPFFPEPEIEVSGFSDATSDAALGMALKSLLIMALHSIGFWSPDDEDDEEETL